MMSQLNLDQTIIIYNIVINNIVIPLNTTSKIGTPAATAKIKFNRLIQATATNQRQQVAVRNTNCTRNVTKILHE